MVSFSVNSNMTRHKQKNITLQGIISADDFDPDGSPMRFVLLTDDENKYILERGKQNTAIDFSKYNRRKVELTGAISFVDKNAFIAVDEIHVLLNPGGAPILQEDWPTEKTKSDTN